MGPLRTQFNIGLAFLTVFCKHSVMRGGHVLSPLQAAGGDMLLDCTMTNRLLCLALATWIGTCCAQAAQPMRFDPIDAGRIEFERGMQAIETALQDEKNAASANYLKDLQTMVRQMEAKGDEFGIRPAKAEIRRFEQSHTVPSSSDVGTPELIQKARTRYHETLARAEAVATTKRQGLTTRYIKYLTNLKEQFEAASKTGDVARVSHELEPLVSVGGAASAAACAAAVSVKGVVLSKGLRSELRLLYTFDGETGRKVLDHSGWRQDGELTGGARAKNALEGDVCTFADSYDMVETKELRIGSYWTVSVRARFPLADKKEARVLVSSAHGKHHVVVDAAGALGIQPKEFIGCGYNVSSLRGWHDITVASSFQGTLFFVDGKMAGVAKPSGPFSGPVNAIGNSAASGFPWGGTLASVMLWTRGLSGQEIAELCTFHAGR